MEFYKSRGFDNLQFIPLAEFDGTGAPLPYTIAPSQIRPLPGRAVRQMNGWPDRRRIRIRFFDNIAEALAGHKPGTCTMHETCDSYVVVEYNGDIYPCDFFVERSWKLRRNAGLGFLERDRKAHPPPQFRVEEDAGASRVPGVRLPVDLSRRMSEIQAWAEAGVRGSRLLLLGLQGDFRARLWAAAGRFEKTIWGKKCQRQNAIHSTSRKIYGSSESKRRTGAGRHTCSNG